MANRGGCELRCSSRPGVFRQDVYLDVGVFVADLGPSSFRLLKHFEPRNTCQTYEFFDAISGKNNIDVLGHSAHKPMPPNRPAAGEDRRTLQDVQQMIDSPDDAAVATG